MTALTVLLTTLATLIAGCAAEPPVGHAAQGSMDVGLLDYELVTSDDAVAPGPLTLEVTNAGADTHDLAAVAGGEEASVPRLAPGDTASVVLEVPETAGEVELWCTLPGHRAQGMRTTLPVAPDTNQQLR